MADSRLPEKRRALVGVRDVGVRRWGVELGLCTR